MPRVDIAVPGIPRPLANYTPATRAGNLVFAAGQLASDFKGGVAPEASLDSAFPYYGSAIKKQTRFILENLAHTFKAAGTSLNHVVKAQVFHTDLANFNAFDEVWREFFPAPPPRTTVGTNGLLVKDTLVEIDLIAALPSARARRISVPDIPRPLAHYTPATRVGDFVFAAGQLASDYRTGVPREARVAAGTSLDQVVKAQVFHTDLANFAGFDEVWKEFFPPPPPRTTIGTTGLLIPGTLVEIDLVATMPPAAGRVVQSEGPRPLASYSEAVVVGDLVFAAGQLASDFKIGVPREARVDPAFPFYGSDVKRQTRCVLENLAKTFKAAGTSLGQVVKAQVFHTDLANFVEFDEVWREFFPTPPPRTTVG